MPVAAIQILAGHPRPVLTELLTRTAEVYAAILESPIDRVQVWITEIDPDLACVEGVPASVLLATRSHSEVEIPFVRLVMMEGRPLEQVTRAIAELTEVVSSTLGGDPARVRVEVGRVPPDHWGIGGVPASERRRAEIEARGG